MTGWPFSWPTRSSRARSISSRSSERIAVRLKQADVDRHRDWFGKHHDKIVGGEELEFPRTVKTLRPGRQGVGVVVTDGPYVESKEFLGGFIVLETAGWDEAVAIASEWPSLVSQANATVSVQRVFERG